MNSPKVLFLDIETSPILAYVWGLFDQTISLSQVVEETTVLSWCAKWRGDPPKKMIYQDVRNQRNIRDDSKILKKIHTLLDEADIVVTQNGVSFDAKVLNARFIINGMTPPSPYEHIDTKRIASGKFRFLSNKLEYMTGRLNKTYTKQDHSDFPGMKMWTECLKGNKKAFESMEEYNKYDVLSLEELYNTLYPWDNSKNFNKYENGITDFCSCGSSRLQKRGVSITATGKFVRYQCQECGAWSRSRQNLLTKEKRASLKVKA